VSAALDAFALALTVALGLAGAAGVLALERLVVRLVTKLRRGNQRGID
jgi:hypothetical protein